MTDTTDVLAQAYQEFLTSPTVSDHYGCWVILGPGPVIHDSAPDPGQFTDRTYPEPYAIIFVSDPTVSWATL